MRQHHNIGLIRYFAKPHILIRLGLFFCLAFFPFSNSFAQNTLSDAERDLLIQKGLEFTDSMSLHNTAAAENERLCFLALPYFEQAEHWEYYVHWLNFLCNVYFIDQNYDSYLQNSVRALALAKKRLPKSNEEFRTATNNSAVGEAIRGNYRQAIPILKDAIQLLDPNARDQSQRANYYHNMGSFYKGSGDYDESINYFGQALKIRQTIIKKTGDKNIPSILAELAHSFKLKGELDTALTVYQQCLDEADQINGKSKYLEQNYLYCYQNMADIYLQNQEEERCLHYIEKALQQQENKSFARAHESYQILGNLYVQQKKYAPAIASFQQANAIAKATYNYNLTKENDKHHTIAQTLVDIGKVYLLQKDTKTALDYFQQALINNTFDYAPAANDFQNLPAIDNFLNLPVALDILQQMATTFYKRYTYEGQQKEDLVKALQYCRLAHKVIQQIRQSYQAEGSKQTLVGKAKAIYEMAIKSAVDLDRITNDPQFLREAFAFSESSKAMILLESIQEQLALGYSGIPDSLLQKEQQLKVDWAYYEKQLALARKVPGTVSPKKMVGWGKQAFDLHETYKELILYFEKNYPKYYQLKFSTALASVEAVQQKILDKEAAMITYFMGAENNFAFCISAGDIKVVQWPVSEKLPHNIRGLRQLLIQEPATPAFAENYASFCQLSNELYQELLAPSLSHLSPAINRLILIPDDLASYLPFEILLRQEAVLTSANFSPKQLDYLFEDFRISYNYSATLLLTDTQKDNKHKRKSFIGFAPDFGQNSDQAQRICTETTLSNLHCNQIEVSSIGANFDGENLIAQSATKTAFTQLAADYRIVHLATHACIDESNINLSQIHFSDGSLATYDLQNLNLNADLVALSACNTGSGKLVKGEGVLSLSRSFTYAGCPSTLMSLWSVDDCATSEIMIAFYDYLAKGWTKDEALRAAKNTYLEQSTDKAKAHPYYWAGFVQTGKTEALFNPAWDYWPYLSFAFLALFVFCGIRYKMFIFKRIPQA